MRTADFLYPDDLAVTRTEIRRILIIGSCNAVSFENYLRRNVPATAVELWPRNHVADLPERPPSDPSLYDFHFIQIPLRSLIADGVIDFKGFAERSDALLRSAKVALRHQLDATLAYNRTFGTFSFVANFPVPQRPVVSAPLQAGQDADLRWLVQQLNDELARLIEPYDHVFVADVEQVGAAVGKRYFQDDVLNFYTHGNHWFPTEREYDIAETHNAPQPGRLDPLPLLEDVYENRSDEVFEALWRQCIATYRTVHQVDQVKMVVFDLDDTLWRGQIAEHYGDGDGDGGRWPVFHGWPTGLWEVVHHLRSRGILTALASKNDAELVAQRWSRAIPAQWLTPDHFVFKEINFEPKAQTIERMIARAGLTPASVLFVDDNPVEREAARAALPGLRTIGANPFVTRRILLWSPETQVVRLTRESAARESMMHQHQRREAERGGTSRAAFLAGLGCRVRLSTLYATTDPSFGRSFELLNKTNQFNTTGRRWKHEQIVDLFRQDGRMIVFEVEDRFSAYGLVGVILYRAGHFLQFAMSCRVLGLEIETSVINAILRREAAERDRFSADVAETEANIVCRTVYGQSGFAQDPARPGRFTRSAAGIAPTAGHLSLFWTEDAADPAVSLRAEDIERRSFAFSRADGGVIGTITLGPAGRLQGYRHPNEESWSIRDGRVVFLNDRGEVSTVFHEVTREAGSLRMAGAFLLGAPVRHVLSEVGPAAG
jgi:FkbH-like protein